MSLAADKSFKMKMRDVENAFKYRRIPYPKRSVELIAILAISCTFFLFMHTNKLNSRLKEMEVKLQPSEFSALGLSGNQISSGDANNKHDINTLHGTYQYLKSTGQRRRRSARQRDPSKMDNTHGNVHQHHHRPARRPAPANPHSHQANTDAGNIPSDHKAAHKDNVHSNGKSPNGVDHDHEDYNEAKDDDDDESGTGTGTDTTDYDYEFGINADKLNNTKKADVEVVFFNRVPKVGSQSLMQLMERLGKINGFGHSRDGGKRYETVLMTPEKQRKTIENVLSKPQPHAFSQHVAYINYTRFHMPKPIYINLVRDPVERVISWHYYVRAEWYYKDMDAKLGAEAPPHPAKEFMEMDLDTCVRIKDPHCQYLNMQKNERTGDHRRQTLFFCGQNQKVCMPFNSVIAMQKAKRTVEEDYAVVGTWEDTNITLTVLEHYIPKFFKGAKIVYYLGEKQLSSINKNPVKRPVSQDTRDQIRQNHTHEIEFYEFCKQRLYMQYAAVTKGERVDNDDYLMIPVQDDIVDTDSDEEY